MSSKRFILIPLIPILLALTALSGCGLKGDLYLPPADHENTDRSNTDNEPDDATHP